MTNLYVFIYDPYVVDGSLKRLANMDVRYRLVCSPGNIVWPLETGGKVCSKYLLFLNYIAKAFLI